MTWQHLERRLKIQVRNQEFFQGNFLRIRHFDKQSSATRERKAPQGKISVFFS